MTADQILIGVLGAVGGALLTSVVRVAGSLWTLRQERVKFFRDKLLDRYAELVALAVEDVERARTIASGMMIPPPDRNYAVYDELETKRHRIRHEMTRLGLQIRLYETHPDLAARVAKLATSQPFMIFPFPPAWGDGNYSERHTKYMADIAAFEADLNAIVDLVVGHHATREVVPAKWTAAAVRQGSRLRAGVGNLTATARRQLSRVVDRKPPR